MRRCSITVALVLLAGCGGGGDDDERAQLVPPREVLERGPYLGVACPVPNAIDCDRVGLSVWLKQPAKAVEAEVGGRRFVLDDADHSRPPSIFAGFLTEAGLDGEGPLRVEMTGPRWYGQPRVRPRVRLTIEREDGRTVTTTLEVPLQAGWG